MDYEDELNEREEWRNKKLKDTEEVKTGRKSKDK